jgi:hypothetical protein
MIAYVAKAGPDECWNWTGGTSVYVGRNGHKRLTPRFMHTPSKSIMPGRWLFDFWHGRPGKPLTTNERLKQSCANPMCVNPKHQVVVALNRKKVLDAAAA